MWMESVGDCPSHEPTVLQSHIEEEEHRAGMGRKVIHISKTAGEEMR